MKKGTKAVIVAVIVAGAAALALWGWRSGALISGTWYVRVDSRAMTEKHGRDGVVDFSGSEPYQYELPAANADGLRTTVHFGAAKQLSNGAYLKLEVQPVRGVVSWEEVAESALPPKVRTVLA